MMKFVRAHAELWAALVTAAVLPVFLSSASLAAEVLIFAMAAAGCTLLLNYAGLMSFGQGIFFGIGSYVLGYLSVNSGWPLGWLLLAVVLGGILAAAVVGWICIRQTGIYFVLLTLALAEMIFFLAESATGITGGDNGLLGVPMLPLNIGGWPLFANKTPWGYYTFVAAVFIVVFAFLGLVVKSYFGRTLIAMRENPDRLAAVGYNTKSLKMLAFMISGAITAVAGALYAMMTGIAPLESINLDRSEIILVVSIIGGGGNIIGAILGALFYVLLSNWLSEIWPRWLMLFGFLLMLISLYFQGGLWGALQTLGRKVGLWRPSGDTRCKTD